MSFENDITFPNLLKINYDVDLCGGSYYALRIMGNSMTEIVFHENFTLNGLNFTRGNQNVVRILAGNETLYTVNISSEDCYVNYQLSSSTRSRLQGCHNLIGYVKTGNPFPPSMMSNVKEIHGTFEIFGTNLDDLNSQKQIKIFAHQ
ncbi:hypothetical protein GCK32_018386, partial [Trichostrongylus colubriformis]